VLDDARVQVFEPRPTVIGQWPEHPSPQHLGSLALVDHTLRVEAPYIDTLYWIQITWPTEAP